MALHLKAVGEVSRKINRSLDELRYLLENSDMPCSAKKSLIKIQSDLRSAKADLGG